MAQIIINVPDEHVNAVLDAFANEYGYQELINGNPNPQSKAAFAKERIIDFMKEVYKRDQFKINLGNAEASAISGSGALGLN